MWLAFMGDNTDNKAIPGVICLGKSPKTVKLFTKKVALLPSILKVIRNALTKFAGLLCTGSFSFGWSRRLRSCHDDVLKLPGCNCELN
jgi:hypothetical protein